MNAESQWKCDIIHDDDDDLIDLTENQSMT